MPPKAKLPMPIDRPLSRAYLRKFGGWSTAYPPGLSEPTSLRNMENILVNRDGSVRVRPGLRYLSYGTLPVDGGAAGTKGSGTPAGTHESFYLNDGSKAYLYAAREVDGTVGFRVLANTTGLGWTVHALTDAGIDFNVVGGLANLAFSAATRYVKFLQIDNKIFALSDSTAVVEDAEPGESMREFFVGATKTAKRLRAINRPAWTVADKLTVVHPDAAWINSAVPTGTRTNRITNPSFETNISGWWEGNAYTQAIWSSAFGQSGTHCMRVESLPERTNLCLQPLYDPSTTGLTGWGAGSGVNAISVAAGSVMRVLLDVAAAGSRGYANGNSMMTTVPGTYYHVAYDLTAFAGVDKVGIMVRFYNSANVQIGADSLFPGGAPAVGRRLTGTFAAPSGGVKMRIYPYAERSAASGVADFRIKNVLVAKADGSSTAALDGSIGANYFWTGAVNASTSVYHPPQDLKVLTGPSNYTTGTHTASIYARSSGTARNVSIDLVWSGGGTDTGAAVADAAGVWTRIDNTGVAPAGTYSTNVRVTILGVPRGEYHYLDSALYEVGALAAYFDGDTTDTALDAYAWSGAVQGSMSTDTSYAAGGVLPAAETKTAATLISSTKADNDYNFGFFYTFSNDIGESAPSQATIVKAQRAWAMWEWETPNAAGEPSGTETADPTLCADQLVAYMPQAVFDEALSAGATSWNLYGFTWSNQDVVPTQALRLDSRPLSPTSTRGVDGWLRMTPAQADANADVALIPSRAIRDNWSDPSRGGQGIVAADRMVLVKDPRDGAKIRWTSNEQAHYTDFTAARGGGYKTLTSGNLQVTACVKLWQNPQSADSLVILNMGTDGHSSGYYMAPAQVASQSEATNIMGFEETTASPGTTSPYGCEVFNNTLYHPLDDQLMKSTASNYNINHKSVSDQIVDRWRRLVDKEYIVSAQHDSRLYYIVNNPLGAEVPEHCNGNEIWIFDGASEAGTWSRYLVPAVSLRKVEQGGRITMSVVTDTGIYYFDDDYGRDDYVDGSGNVQSRAIPWRLETNTQGANRAHDAWCHLQQLSISLGNFQGTMRYGIRSWDINGKPVEIAKIVRDFNDPLGPDKFDLEDQLLVRRDLKEWFFFAESTVDDSEAVVDSFGQINLVQYRYTPVSVNVGYEYGSIETFEYGRATVNWADRTSDNGVPIPANDPRRP